MRKILYIIPLFILAFTFTGEPPSGWYQQFMPDTGGRTLQDVFFLDSLTGWSVTNATNQNPDTTYVLKTTNGGDNWVIQYAKIQTGGGFPGYFRVHFLNTNTGYTCGVKGVDKTTDGGTSWTSLNAPLNSYLDMSVINEDSIWIASSNPLTGGVFRTTNGGVNWEQQLNLGSQNPTHIYFYNKDTGFCAANTLYRTTNSGINWIQVPGGTGFGDMHFVNSSTGWKCYGPIQKTTDGGLNWNTLSLPPKGGSIVLSRVNRMHVLNKDTIWGVGSVGIINSVGRGLIYITTDGGNTWGYQNIDTSINSGQYQHIQFINKNTGWAYWAGAGVHTITGGSDTTIYLNIQQTSNEIPQEFMLYQNYPNPFNPVTNIKFKVQSSNNFKLIINNVAGKEVTTLVDEKLNPGEYHYSFNANSLSSGIYFYSLLMEGIIIDTKKMILVK